MDRKTFFEYIKTEYKVTPDYPWKKYPDNAVFRHSDNNKWFALVMDVARDKLGQIGAERITVVKLKIADALFRDTIIREEGIIPAYHMNKQNWITVFLDGTVPEERVYDLLDMSYRATASAKVKEKIRLPKDWIIPANPKYYDIEHAFDNTDEIDWKQGRGIRVGDTVYMYVAAPVSAILYKCKVLETDIPYEYQDRNLVLKALMKIRLMKRYDSEAFTFDVLKEEYGIYAVRGPRGVPYSLSQELG